MNPRTRISVPFVLAILAFAQTQALAQFYSGNDLVALMRENERADSYASGVDFVKVREYGAYILAVCDATWLLYSLPDGTTKGQIIAVVSNYLKNHPEKWAEPAAPLVIKALQEAFPPKRTK